MISTIPPRPETVEALEQAIEQGYWPRVWGRDVLGVPESKSNLWLRLAQEVWQTANFEEVTSSQDPDKDILTEVDALGVMDDRTEYETEDKTKNDSSHAELGVDNGQESSCSQKSCAKKDQYSPDERIARLLVGCDTPCGNQGKLTPEQQDTFEQATFAEIRQSNDSQATDRDVRIIYIRLIEKGREFDLWDLCLPSYPVIISRPIPRNRRDNLNRLFVAREIRAALLSAIRENPPWLAEHQLGLILLSAMLWDGLLEKTAIEALASSLDRPLLRGPTGFWLDLLLDPDKPARTRIRRFWPQSLTTMLWLRHEGRVEPEKTADQAVRDLVTRLLKRESPSLPWLIKGIAQELALNIPEILVHVATGETLTHPIKAGRWHAIQGIGHPGADVPELDDAARPADSNASNEQLVEEMGERSQNEPLLQLVNPPGMVGLRKAMRGKSVGEIIQALEYVLQEEASQPFIVNHLARWLKKPAKRAKVSTRRWMFGQISARLVSLCGEDDPKQYDDDELESLYAQVLEDGKSSSQRIGMRYALKSFHSYLSKDDPIKRPSLLDEIERSKVSSRVITYEEYHSAMQLLQRPGPTEDDPQWLVACQIALILFFRLGIRRRELLMLPLHDIHGKYTIEILIRPFSERTLKTNNALRSLTLNGFLSEWEFDLVQEWLERRRNDATVNPDEFFFFSLANSDRAIISEDRVIERIVDALRTASCDPNIHIHHLRHSFATWSVLSLIGDVVEDDFEAWSHLPDTQHWLREFPMALKMYYAREAPQRGLIYQISSLMGHSTPAITLEHYIHCTDFLFSSAMKTSFRLNLEEIGASGLGLPRRTYHRWSVNGWRGIIDGFATRYKERWTRGEENTDKVRGNNEYIKNTCALYMRYLTIWQALKWVDTHGKFDFSSPLYGEVDNKELSAWLKCAEALKENRLINKGYPSFPYGKQRELVTQKYAGLFEAAMDSVQGKRNINKICRSWLNYKISGRSALRFRNPEPAREYVHALIQLGIPWSQLNFTWVGSRYTQKYAKECRAYWRNNMGLSRRITIGTTSIHNDRPLSETKGYMHVRVINEDVQKDSAGIKASEEFRWLVMMLIMDGDYLCVLGSEGSN